MFSLAEKMVFIVGITAAGSAISAPKLLPCGGSETKRYVKFYFAMLLLSSSI